MNIVNKKPICLETKVIMPLIKIEKKKFFLKHFEFRIECGPYSIKFLKIMNTVNKDLIYIIRAFILQY